MNETLFPFNRAVKVMPDEKIFEKISQRCREIQPSTSRQKLKALLPASAVRAPNKAIALWTPSTGFGKLLGRLSFQCSIFGFGSTLKGGFIAILKRFCQGFLP
jgi:hypothetical protein